MTQSEMFIMGAGFISGSYVTMLIDSHISKRMLPVYLHISYTVSLFVSIVFSIATS